MARGDVVADVISLAHDNSTVIRPADGVEWVIKTWAGQGSASMLFRATDGTSISTIATGAQAAVIGGLVTVPLNYTNYLTTYNGTGGTAIFAYYGYITK